MQNPKNTFHALKSQFHLHKSFSSQAINPNYRTFQGRSKKFFKGGVRSPDREESKFFSHTFQIFGKDSNIFPIQILISSWGPDSLRTPFFSGYAPVTLNLLKDDCLPFSQKIFHVLKRNSFSIFLNEIHLHSLPECTYMSVLANMRL